MDKIARSPAVAKITDRTGCQWPSRSFKVNNLYVLSEGVYHFLLVIGSNPGHISCHLRDTASFSLKLSVKNCGQTAADGDMVTIDIL